MHLITHWAVESRLQPARLRTASLFKRKQNKNTPVFLILGSHQDASLRRTTQGAGGGTLTINSPGCAGNTGGVWRLWGIFGCRPGAGLSSARPLCSKPRGDESCGPVCRGLGARWCVPGLLDSSLAAPKGLPALRCSWGGMGGPRGRGCDFTFLLFHLKGQSGSFGALHLCFTFFFFQTCVHGCCPEEEFPTSGPKWGNS